LVVFAAQQLFPFAFVRLNAFSGSPSSQNRTRMS